MNKYLLAGIVHEAMTNENFRILIVLHYGRHCHEAFDRMSQIAVPAGAITAKRKNGTRIELANGSEIIFVSHRSKALRGVTANRILIDSNCVSHKDGLDGKVVDYAQAMVSCRQGGRVEYIAKE